MGFKVNLIYGAILIYLAAEALGWINVLPKEFLPYAILLMGVVVILTHRSRKHPGLPYGYTPQRSAVYYVRRYVFGIILLWIGVASSVSAVGDLTPLLLIGTRSGSLILAAIAVIYFLSAFERTRVLAAGSSI